MPVNLGSGFSRSSRKPDYPDLKSIVEDRTAAGLSAMVRQSFTTFTCERDPSEGTIGWGFTQNGLNYAVRYKDEYGNDSYDFGVEYPRRKPFLHRLDHMCIAEKAHTLAVVFQCMEPDVRNGLRYHLRQLEIACFKEDTGLVKEGPSPFQRTLIPNGKIKGHIGLNFPPDQNYAGTIEPAVLALEWDADGKNYFIDCSEVMPRFLLGYSANPNMLPICMTRTEAKSAVNYAKIRTNVVDPELARLCGVSGLWNRLENIAEWLSEVRQPSTP